MSRVLLLSADLLFGSRVQAQLQAAGEEVELVADAELARRRLAGPAERRPQLLVIDLTDGDLGGEALLASLGSAFEGVKPRTLGFYSHVEVHTRARAERAGIEMVVPRSRMAREGAELVAKLLARGQPERGSGGAR